VFPTFTTEVFGGFLVSLTTKFHFDFPTDNVHMTTSVCNAPATFWAQFRAGRVIENGDDRRRRLNKVCLLGQDSNLEFVG
jgi:hypothetical protein